MNLWEVEHQEHQRALSQLDLEHGALESGIVHWMPLKCLTKSSGTRIPNDLFEFHGLGVGTSLSTSARLADPPSCSSRMDSTAADLAAESNLGATLRNPVFHSFFGTSLPEICWKCTGGRP